MRRWAFVEAQIGIVVAFLIFTPVHSYPSRVPIQTFLTPEDRERGVLTALNHTVNRLNGATQNLRFLLSHRSRTLRVPIQDTWAVINGVCTELQSGFMVMLIGENRPHPHEAYYAVANTLEVPLVNWDLFETAPLTAAQVNNVQRCDRRFSVEVNVQPPNAELIADVLVLKGWTSFIYVHDAENANQASTNLQWIYHYLSTRTNESITSEILILPADVADFEHFLMAFNLRRFAHPVEKRIVLDTATTFRQQQLLKAIRSAQFNQAQYHWLIANYDLQPFDVEMYQSGNINITGFQLVDRDNNREYSLLKKAVDASRRESEEQLRVPHDDDLDAKLAFVHDALLVTKAALETALKRNDSLFHRNFRHGDLYNRGYPGIYCHPSLDKNNPSRPFSTFEHGRMIGKGMGAIKLTPSDGSLSGNIEFDARGRRRNFLVTVIDLASNMKSAFNRKEFLSWRQGVGFLKNHTIAQHTRKPMLDVSSTRKVIRLATTLVEPFVMIRRDCEGVEVGDGVKDANASSTQPSMTNNCQGNDRYEGFCIDLLKLLSDKIEDFHYEIFVAAGNKPGAKQPDGSWDGLIGHLLRGEADAAVASLTISQDRERVVDFSKPFMTTGISIMIKKPDKQEFSVFSFMQPLSSEIWMYIIFAYVGVSVVIFLVSRFSPYEWRVEEMANGGFTISNDFSVYNCLWFTLAAFMQQGTDILPRSISGRIASSAWWFFTMIIVSSYTANLAAFLTLEKMQAPIESVEDLAKQTKIKYGIQGGGSTAQFFKHSSVQIYQRMWRFMEAQVPSVFTSSYAEGIDRVRNHKGRYAFLLEATANEYANTRKPCDTMKVGANLNSVGYGVATPFGSEWKDQINLAILALQERGELKKLENKWWYDRGQCDHGISDGASASLNLSKVAGIFYILMGGMVASMLAALGEFVYRSRIEARKGQISSMKSLRSSFCGQLRLSVQGGAIAREGGSAHEAIKRHKISSLLPANCQPQQPAPIATITPKSTCGKNQACRQRCNGNSDWKGGGGSERGSDGSPPGYDGMPPPPSSHLMAGPYHTQV